MSKQELLRKFYSNDEYDNMSLSELTTLAHFYDVEIQCVVTTQIYNILITDDMCTQLNKLYKGMTCRNINCGKMNYDELCEKFKEIKTTIVIN